MTYAQLAGLIEHLTPEQQQMDVTVYLSESDEFIPVESIKQNDGETNVLDESHPYLVVNF